MPEKSAKLVKLCGECPGRVLQKNHVKTAEGCAQRELAVPSVPSIILRFLGCTALSVSQPSRSGLPAAGTSDPMLLLCL